jgi:hypothetical protein
LDPAHEGEFSFGGVEFFGPSLGEPVDAFDAPGEAQQDLVARSKGRQTFPSQGPELGLRRQTV